MNTKLFNASEQLEGGWFPDVEGLSLFSLERNLKLTLVCYAGALYRFPGKRLLSCYGFASTVVHLCFTELCCATSPCWVTEPESSSWMKLKKVLLDLGISLLKDSLSVWFWSYYLPSDKLAAACWYYQWESHITFSLSCPFPCCITSF